MAAECFDGVCQAVESMGRKQQAIKQQRVGRDGGVAQTRALHGDEKEHQLQRQ